MDPTATNEASVDNLVDKAAISATKAVDATKTITASALDSVADKVESVRSTLSPALNNASAPFDAVLAYTREKPFVGPAGRRDNGGHAPRLSSVKALAV